MLIYGAVAIRNPWKHMPKPRLMRIVPTTVNGAVGTPNGAVIRPAPPLRQPNSASRAREYLTETEVEKLITTAGKNRHGQRDSTMILMAYRHGLRSAEVVALRWNAIDFDRARLHVRRVKGSVDAVHPLAGQELRALRRLQREQEPKSAFVFTSERGAPFTTRGFRTMIERLGVVAGIDFPVHAHMLRHACGYKLANDGVDTRTLQDWLGHSNIQHTVRYTRLSASKFKGLWPD
jgi:type 1 fimbriae regulatory protein FimB/type 1 fimbriae regulatory protein FimE